jgi:uncharacterized damage-inducible protein DinB
LDVSRTFLTHSRRFLLEDFLPKIRLALDRLSEDDVWWRSNPSANSVGNLILHLSGNLRQWVVVGVGGGEDVRNREAEFEADGGFPKEDLLDGLARTVEEAANVLADFPESRLLEPRRIQGREVTALEAVYHAVEHFSMHTGQILYIARLRSGQELGFYELVDGVPRPTWGRRTN